MEEMRSQDQEDERVARLLGSLPAADAPENFEAMVRSRIAGRRPSESLTRPVFWLALKFAAPVALLMFLGAFLALSDDSSLNVGLVPPIDAPGVASADLTGDEPENTLALNPGNSSRRLPQNSRNVERSGTGQPSQDEALSQDDTTIFPPGVDPRRALQTNQSTPAGGSISASAILSMFGIATSCSDAGCTVVSIQPNSLASKVGIESGDLIEAIDDRRIRAGSSFEGSVNVSSLRIVRSGKRSTIVIGSR